VVDAHAAVAHQFEEMPQQREASALGMWVFLVTEILFFGGMILGYTIYRAAYSETFAAASRHLDIVLGTANTAVLIGSSLTMALAVHASEIGSRRLLVLLLAVTALLGAVFLGVKVVEYGHKFEEHLVPGRGFDFSKFQDPSAALFFSFYFTTTALHALHLLIGIGAVLVVAALAWRGRFSADYYNPVEVTGLYWHFVDIVWIFLYPLLYLIGLHR
jgi:cytochrome c oxidase subunit 3